MATITDFRLDYNTLPIFDLTPFDNVSLDSKDGMVFASAYDALGNYNQLVKMLKDPVEFRAENGEDPTPENLYVTFQAAVCSLRQENIENIEGEISSINVSKIHELAKVHFDQLEIAKKQNVSRIIQKYFPKTLMSRDTKA